MTDERSTKVARSHIAEDVLVLTAGLGAGAGLMYLWDAKRGGSLRGRLASKFSRLVRRDEGMSSRAKDLLHRVGGFAAETASALTEAEPVTDEVLAERVRSRAGQLLSHPHEVRIQARDGVVRLEGSVTKAEDRRLREAIRTIPGVERIDDRLTIRSLLATGVLISLAAGFALFSRTGSPVSRATAGKAS